jgi:hypothetical protein
LEAPFSCSESSFDLYLRLWLRVRPAFELLLSSFCFFIRNPLSLPQSLSCIASISSHSFLLTPSLDRLLLLNLRQRSFLNPSVLIRFLLYLLLLPLCLKSESRSHLLRTEQDRPGAFFGPELLHQLSATLVLLLLVLESLDCLLSSKSFEGSLRPACLEVIAKPFHHFLGLLVYRLVDDASKLPQTRRRVPTSRRTAR